MNIKTTILEDHQAKLTVEYSSETFEGFKHRAAKKIAKHAKIPGFRPGKAPYNVIVNHYGEGTIIQEAIDLLLDEDYSSILEKAEIKPSGPGNLEAIESYDPPTFVFQIPLEPEVNLGDYREIRKNYELETFDISKVDEFIYNLRRNAATIIPADHPAEEGDLVYFNLSGEFLNPVEDEDATITDKTPQQVVIPFEEEESDEEWPFSGFAKELLGVKASDVKEIQHTYPEDHPNDEYKGKTAVFTVEVQSVKELELPEFDEEFVETLGEYESPEDFRNALEERMRTEHQRKYDQKYFDELLIDITDSSEIKFPPQMLEHEEEHVLEDIKSRLEQQNLDFETYLKLRETDEEKFKEEEIRPTAEKRLKRSLVVDALIEAEGLKIDQELLQENINQLVSEILSSRDINNNAEEMRKRLKNEEFSRAISMEGVSRTMDAQLQERLKLIATGQPIPEEEEIEESAEVEETIPEVEDNKATSETNDLEEEMQEIEEIAGSDEDAEQQPHTEDVEKLDLKDESKE